MIAANRTELRAALTNVRVTCPVPNGELLPICILPVVPVFTVIDVGPVKVFVPLMMKLLPVPAGRSTERQTRG